MSEDIMQKLSDKITRFEVIDENGRAYVRYDIELTLELQDEDRTLKIFISPRKSDTAEDQENRKAEEFL